LASAQNHAEDVVAPLASNVHLAHHAALNARACVCQPINFVMSLSAMSLGDWLSVNKKVGQAEVAWYIHPKGENGMTVSGFGCQSPSVGNFPYL